MKLKKFIYLTFSIIMLFFGLLSCQKDEVINVKDEGSVSFGDDVINDRISGIPVVVYGNAKKSFFTAFRSIDEFGKKHEFIRSQENFPDVLEDENGNVWNVNGIKQTGGNAKLLAVSSLVGYWFSFPSFFENIKLYDGPEMHNDFSESGSSNWLVNRNYIFAGSVKGGIQALNQPEFINVKDKAFLQSDFYKNFPGEAFVSVVKNGNVTHAYPHRILEYHEVVNDRINGIPVTFSYCPLTGTSRAWNPEINGKVCDFGVSGLLYNNNLILYDISTDSNWSQILNRSVNGPLAGVEVNDLQVLELRMEDLPSLSGLVKILSPSTGLGYDYKFSIYKNYAQTESINFPVIAEYGNISSKERVIGITVDDSTRVYRFKNFK